MPLYAAQVCSKRNHHDPLWCLQTVAVAVYEHFHLKQYFDDSSTPELPMCPYCERRRWGQAQIWTKNFRIFVIVVIIIYVPGRYAYTAECTWSSSSGSPWRGSPSLLRAGVYDPSSVLLRQPNSWSDLVCACGNFERQPTYENKTVLNLSTVQLWNKT